MLVKICASIILIMITIVMVLFCAELILNFFGSHLEDILDDIDNVLYSYFHRED